MADPVWRVSRSSIVRRTVVLLRRGCLCGIVGALLAACGSPDGGLDGAEHARQADPGSLATRGDTAHADHGAGPDGHAVEGGAAAPHDLHAVHPADPGGAAGEGHAGHAGQAADPHGGHGTPAGVAAAADPHGGHGTPAGVAAAAGHDAHTPQRAGVAGPRAGAEPHAGHDANAGERRGADAGAGRVHPASGVGGAGEGHAGHHPPAAQTAPGSRDPAQRERGPAGPSAGQTPGPMPAADGAARIASLVEALLTDDEVRQRIQQDPVLHAMWSDPAVREAVRRVPEGVRAMEMVLELVRGLLSDPSVISRIEADPTLRELWSDPAVRQLAPRR
jgi:hypothetical protein